MPLCIRVPLLTWALWYTAASSRTSAVAEALLLIAGVTFAATSTAKQHEQRSAPSAAHLKAIPAARGPFPAEPYLAPTTECPIDTQQVGPELQLAVPINYHVLLNLSDPAFYQPGDATGRVAAGFGGEVNITMHVKQVGLVVHNAACSTHSRAGLLPLWPRP